MKKTKITKITAFFGLLIAFFTLTAFSQPNLDDSAQLTNLETRKLIAAKTNRYLQTKEQPQIIVITLNRINDLTPKRLNKSKRTVYIVVGKKGNKKNIQIYSSKDLHGAFTADTRMNILRIANPDLKSKHKSTFNRGLQYVYKACATKIDQQYDYTFDKYDLDNKDFTNLTHPNHVALPIAAAVVILIGALIWFLKSTQKKTHTKD